MFFVRLRLSRARHDIDKNKKIIQWFRYINEYRRVWGENMFSNKKMYGTLKFSIPEANLALMLQSMDDIQDVQELAKIMKSHLYKMWKDGKKTPDTIAQFLKIPNSKPMNTEFDPRYKILEEFTEVFNGENGKKLIRSNTMP
ncbi:RxLR effector protein [Phytophthora megakarya]|uniref:RxLR effector protein n=1 Tax=Phytophthora megakarya TaxID=4795 RepID=A0A225WDQ7_9STRA|nr:RxLR effector protein [Phytophthora megakarya]